MDTGLQPGEGEFFLDQAQKPIPPRDTWHQLTTNELIDVKSQLQEKAWAFAKNPAISKALVEGLQKLELMLQARYAGKS